MDGRIPTHIVKERSIRITELCKRLIWEKNKGHLGKKYSVLITERGKHQTFSGRAENYKQIIVRENVHIGDVVSVEVIEASQTHLVGRLI
jgi:tRNA A37 methylthiotransferase MiaB